MFQVGQQVAASLSRVGKEFGHTDRSIPISVKKKKKAWCHDMREKGKLESSCLRTAEFQGGIPKKFHFQLASTSY